MNTDVRGPRVIITAGASGIGLAVAKAFTENGARAHVCDIQKDLVRTCQNEIPGLTACHVDIADPAQVKTLFAEAMDHLGGLDVLISNAGIAGPTARVEDITPDDWNRTMDVNINGQFYCVRHAVPLLKASGGGSIINMSSSAGILGYPMRSPYAASKWAVIGFTKTLAMELGEFGIRVNAICPNAVTGPRMDAVIAAEAGAKNMTEKEIYDNLVSGTSLRTFVTTDDVANMILFLCSDAGCRISGQALSIDGHTETLR